MYFEISDLQACIEPSFLRVGISKFDSYKWPAVMNALDSLVLRVSALDSLIEVSQL